MSFVKRVLANAELADLGAAVDNDATLGDVPLTKIMLGAEGSFTPLEQGQQSGANSLSVVIASDQGSIGEVTTKPTAVTFSQSFDSVSSTAENALAANSNRVAGWIQPLDGALWVNIGSTAVANQCTYLSRGTPFLLYGSTWVTTQLISVLAASGTVNYIAVEG